MESFVHIQALTQPPPPPSPHGAVSSSDRPLGPLRSATAVPTINASTTATTSSHSSSTTTTSTVPATHRLSTEDRPRVPSKSTSTPHLSIVQRRQPSFLGDEMSTLPDPRSRSRSPANGNGLSRTQSHHPDLNEEVAALSTKLINAINHQTHLDDTLTSTRHELQTAHGRIKELEEKNASQREMMAGDIWVRRSTLDTERRAMQQEKKSLQSRLNEETSKRVAVEMEKKKIEQELENLTADLFQEANKMVVRAKEEAQVEHQALQRKNDQLKSQVADTESLLKSQQEQLSELKQVLETMTSERDTQPSGTAPSSPRLSKFDARDVDRSLAEGIAALSANEGLPPSHPTSFHHLIQPVLRTDLGCYDDFVALARTSRRQPGSRISSGSMVGLSAMSMALGGSSSSAHQSSNSTSSLTASNSGGLSAPQSPNTAGPASSSPSNMTPPGSASSQLKDSRFFKRVLAEDVEPTLRLDTAPGLSWLARRSVISSMADGSLVVEPVPASTNYIPIARPHFYPCSLCGESRSAELHLRNHRFRTSEAESAQRYPLCKYCLNRVRSTCDFLGFLRMVKDGHFRADDEDHEKSAWEESVRLREQMFWSRIGGGVVPASQHGATHPEGERSSGRPSHERSDAAAASEQTGQADKTSSSEAKAGEGDARTTTPEIREPVPEPHTPPGQTGDKQGTHQSTQVADEKKASASHPAPSQPLSISIPPMMMP